MCGILYSKLKSPKIKHDSFYPMFNQALEKMHYRGPDSKGIEVIDNHYFGHVRLSIIDLHYTSNQPFQDDEHLMIYNGEIYNYKEIDPSSTSDTTTLFECMKSLSNPFEKLRGMFAFGFFDKKTGEISFYRDFFGEKPLYYYADEDVDIVSSTLKSIVDLLKSMGKKLKLAEQSIKNEFLLFGYLREPNTIWENVLAVPAGHKLYYDDGIFKTKSLFFNIASAEMKWDDSLYVKHALSSTDVEGSLLLSGGIDSTYILAESVKYHNHLLLGIYKAENPDIDESDKALDNIARMEVDGNLFPTSILTHSEEPIDIDAYARILEQPSSDGLQLFSILSYLRLRNPKLKLVYTGLGGDELFGGYPIFFNFEKISALINIPYIGYIFPKFKRFVFGKKALKTWDAEVYSFLYRLNYANFEAMGLNSQDLKNLYKKYQESLALVPDEAKNTNKENWLDIKKSEVFQYCKNQLLRDNDNIAMQLGFESRSPLLNADWYLQHVDSKRRLKNFLEQTFGISFGKKKGFTLDESKARSQYLDYIQKNRDNTYLPVNLFDSPDALSIQQLRTIAILTGWLKYNT